jgi:hypothetical protein
MNTWALIGVSKASEWPPAPAKEAFWTSTQFRGAYKSAESSGQTPLILSTDHGVITPDQTVYPFENQLSYRL